MAKRWQCLHRYSVLFAIDLKAEQIGEITSDDLYIYSSPTLASRPITVIREGVLESLRFPSNTLFACQRLGAAHDLLLLQGIEPDLHWQQFADAIIECLQTFKAQRLYTIGGYLDYAPHTRMPRLSAVVTHEALKDELEAYDVDLTDYEGPTSIQSYLLAACRAQGIEGISLWGGAPSYVQGSYPRLTQAMLQFLSQLWRLPSTLRRLRNRPSSWRRPCTNRSTQTQNSRTISDASNRSMTRLRVHSPI